MVVVEVGFLCGFKVDLLKINVIGFDYKEIFLDKVVFYFKNVCFVYFLIIFIVKEISLKC